MGSIIYISSPHQQEPFNWFGKLCPRGTSIFNKVWGLWHKKTWGLLASIWDLEVLDYLISPNIYRTRLTHRVSKSLVLGEIFETVEISKSQVFSCLLL